MLIAIMVATMCHFMAEQKSMQEVTFIPLAGWHKLVNTFLLIEQCSLVLFLGKLSGTIGNEVEASLFGINLLLILVMQERDSVTGEIKWSVLPLALNNTYMVGANFVRYYQAKNPDGPSSPSSQPQASAKTLPVNQEKVFYSLVWYAGTMVGYAMMEAHG